MQYRHTLQAYYQFLRNMCYLAPIGWVLCMIRPGVKGRYIEQRN